jgi:hypothetical protein
MAFVTKQFLPKLKNSNSQIKNISLTSVNFKLNEDIVTHL